MSNTFAGKLGVAFVALAMALMYVAPAKAAQTPAELQAQIDTLMATITALQAQLGVTTPAASASAYVFTRPLTIGSQGADVTALQNYLIAGGHAIPAGATGYFGAQTAAAVAAWQTANGVMPASGYFGPVSQAKYAALMASTPTTPTTPTTPSTGSDLKGEASLGDVDLKEGDDTEIEEGQEDAPVADLDINFDNGDAKITRMDVSLVAQGSEEDAWKTFDTVTLWVDGDEVGSVDASDKDNYLGDEDNGILRFSGLDIMAMEDEDVTVTVGVTVQDGVDDLSATWDVNVENVRFVDGEDVTSTEVLSETATSFDINAAGSDDEVLIKSSSEDPNATTIQLKDDKKTSPTTVFAFDLDTKDSTNDIDLNEIIVKLAAFDPAGNATNTSFLINDAELVIDGETIDDVTITGTTVGSYKFNIDGDVTINAGDRVTVEFKPEFKALGSTFEGSTIKATVVAADIDSEGADDITATGAASGETHTLRTSGADLEPGTMSSTLITNDTPSLKTGTFVVKFDVTAFDTDLFVAKSAASSTGSSNGVSYRVTDGSGNGAGTSTAQSASLSSTADSEVGTDSVSRFKVAEGETETFTLTVNYDPANVGKFYGIQLYSLNFKRDNTAAATVTQQKALPAQDYETDPLAI